MTHQMAGTLDLDSRHGVGTTVTLTLPARQGARRRQPPSSHGPITDQVAVGY